MNVFLREFEAPVNFPGPEHVAEYEVCDPKAGVVSVSLRKEWAADGVLAHVYIVFTVRDRAKGPISKPTARKAVVVVRRKNDLIPLTDDCGKLLDYVQSSDGRFQFYVFEALRAAQPIGSTSEETTSPRPPKAASKPAPQPAEPSCPCVVDGTSFHQQAVSPAAQTPAEEEEQVWWLFPSEEPASGVK